MVKSTLARRHRCAEGGSLGARIDQQHADGLASVGLGPQGVVNNGGRESHCPSLSSEDSNESCVFAGPALPDQVCNRTGNDEELCIARCWNGPSCRHLWAGSCRFMHSMAERQHVASLPEAPGTFSNQIPRCRGEHDEKMLVHGNRIAPQGGEVISMLKQMQETLDKKLAASTADITAHAEKTIKDSEALMAAQISNLAKELTALTERVNVKELSAEALESKLDGTGSAVEDAKGMVSTLATEIAVLAEQVRSLQTSMQILAKSSEAVDNAGTTHKEHEKEGAEEDYDKDKEQPNKQLPLWMRDPEEVTHEDYSSFYTSLSKDQETHLAVKQACCVEGGLQIWSLLFIPRREQIQQPEPRTNIILYIQRDIFADNCDELLPEWLNMVRGVVDIEALPDDFTNFHAVRKILVNKCLEMFEEIADKKEDYSLFYQQFGKHIKLGMQDISVNRTRLAGLLRFHTSHSGHDRSGLKEYVDRMKEGQRDIYYSTAKGYNGSKNKGPEVLYLSFDDEAAVRKLKEFDGKKLKPSTKEGKM